MNPTHHDPIAPFAGGRLPRGPASRLLDLFSSVWFGVLLIFLLFIYASIGSAGLPIGSGVTRYPFILRPDAWVPVREFMDRSEFDWFNWWPFGALVGLLCVTLVVTTVRRVPLNAVHLGVWLVHSGLIVLALGSVWYFSAKIEGDAYVARRRVVAQLPGQAPVRFLATPGNRARIGHGEEAYALTISAITPNWELLSGDDKGTHAYKVSVTVQGPSGLFIRELLAGFPQYTEDLVRSGDARQPFARAKKTRGTPLVDTTLTLGLEYDPQEYLYLVESAAIYLREAGTREWIERPIRNLPRYRDALASYDEVWTAPGEALPPLKPLDIEVPAVDPRDPLPGVNLRVSAHLRYATIRTRQLPGGDRLDPAASIRLETDDGRRQDFELRALDPAANALGGGVIEFRWIASEAELAALREVRPPMLHIIVPEASYEEDVPVTAVTGGDESAPFTPIGATGYAYRVRSMQDRLNIEGRVVSIAIVEIRHGDRRFVRWVFDDPRLTRDLAAGSGGADHAEPQVVDEGIGMRYAPGRRPGVRLVAGPEEQTLRLLVPAGAGIDEQPVTIGDPMPINAGVRLTVTRFLARSRTETRPFIVPPAQRDHDVGARASMIRVHLPLEGAAESRWLSYQLYPFPGAADVLSRFTYQPRVLHLPDGRHVEMLFSRRRMRLPAPVALDRFILSTHAGGYAGSTQSVRDWTSVVRFGEPDGTWSSPVSVSVNDPQEHGGFWFFQSQWDPPERPRGPGDPGSQGLNYTVLGVGNRHGVLVQLAGCCLAVIGMIYAFYVKPVVRRRRQELALARAAAVAPAAREAPAAARPRDLVGAGGREEKP